VFSLRLRAVHDCVLCFAEYADALLCVDTGKTPYECPHCDKAFTRSDVRAKHITTMHPGSDRSRDTERDRGGSFSIPNAGSGVGQGQGQGHMLGNGNGLDSGHGNGNGNGNGMGNPNGGRFWSDLGRHVNSGQGQREGHIRRSSENASLYATPSSGGDSPPA
jgi:hypothetical protein